MRGFGRQRCLTPLHAGRQRSSCSGCRSRSRRSPRSLPRVHTTTSLSTVCSFSSASAHWALSDSTFTPRRARHRVRQQCPAPRVRDHTGVASLRGAARGGLIALRRGSRRQSHCRGRFLKSLLAINHADDVHTDNAGVEEEGGAEGEEGDAVVGGEGAWEERSDALRGPPHLDHHQPLHRAL